MRGRGVEIPFMRLSPTAKVYRPLVTMNSGRRNSFRLSAVNAGGVICATAKSNAAGTPMHRYARSHIALAIGASALAGYVDAIGFLSLEGFFVPS
jgi:hypothetical protein